jgi:hypothetical protein
MFVTVKEWKGGGKDKKRKRIKRKEEREVKK